MLQKNILTVFTPGSPGVPADPGSPGRPAYDEVLCTTERIFVIDEILCITSDTPPFATVCVNRGHYEDRTICRIVHHPAEAPRPPSPAIPPTPDQFTTDLQLGWNSGAVSISRLTGDVECKFKIPNAVGIVVGLSSASLGVTYKEIQYAFYFSSGLAQVYESGSPVGSGVLYVPNDEFMLRRIGDTVTYFRNGILLYTSLIPTRASLIVDCALFSGGDQID